jgi:hypothetical protein
MGYIKLAVFGALEHVTSVVELKYRIAAATEMIIPEILKYVCLFNQYLGVTVCMKLIMGMELDIKKFHVKSMMFPHRNIHKFSWASYDVKTHNQIDHTFIDRRRHSSVLDV